MRIIALLIATLYAYGRRLLADTSDKSYNNDEISVWQRKGRSSHNAIEVDGKSMYNGWQEGTENLNGNGNMIINKRFDLFEGYYEERLSQTEFTRQTRRILFVKPAEFCIVSDYITAPKGKHEFKQTWHMEPPASPQIEKDTKISKSCYVGGANIYIIPADNHEINASIDRGFMGGDEHKYISYIKNHEDNAKYDTVLYPVNDKDSTRGTVSIIEPYTTSKTMTAFKINFSNESGNTTGFYYNSFENDSLNKSFGEYSFDSSTIYIQNNIKGGQFTVALYSSSYLDVKGQSVISCSKKLSDLGIVWNENNIEICSSIMDIKELGQVSVLAEGNIESVLFNGNVINYYKNHDRIIIN